MKRVPELRNLSDDHHRGLVLARKAKRAASGEESVSAHSFWANVEEVFKTELEPHFQIEESLIAPILDARGEPLLAKRLCKEHEALRQLLTPESDRTPANLQRFGELLEQHIRFEERELFEAAQNILSPDALHAVAKACSASDDSE